MYPHNHLNLKYVLKHRPAASAIITGSDAHPAIKGTVYFFEAQNGVLVLAEVFGLPAPDDVCKSPFFGMHIHEGGECSGNESDPFANARSHYNPDNCAHPHHAGDLVPLLGSNGYAFLSFYTNRFLINEIIGKTIVIHKNPDDFTTQPAGNSGTKIACGVIMASSK